MSARDRLPWVALRRAVDWRLLVAWTAGVALPTSAGVIPMWLVLGTLLDHSPRAPSIAERFDLIAFEDIVAGFARQGSALLGAGAVSFASAWLLSPWLTGMTVGLARAGRRLRLAEVVSEGFVWYGRMFRMMLVSLVPLAAVVGVAYLAFGRADRFETRALEEAHAHWAHRGAWAVTLVALALAHATVEAGRAAFGSSDDLRSAFRAWLRGIRLIWGRPLPVLGLYLGTSLAGFALAALFLWMRLRVSGPSGATEALGLLLTQLAAASVGWARASRLFALIDLSSRTGTTTRPS